MLGMLAIEILTSKHRQDWEVLASCEEATIFHTCAWEELLRLGCKDETPLYWGLFLDNELAAIWPTSVIHAFGGRILYSLPHSNFGAPLVKRDITVPLQELVSHVSEAVMKRGVLHWSVDVPEDSPILGLISRCGFQIAPASSCTFTLDTRLDPNLLWERLNRDKRRNVRKAQREGLEVYEATEREELFDYFGIYQSTMKRHHRKGVTCEFFDLLYELLVREHKAMVLLARKGNKTVAGIVLLLHNAKAYWWSGASLEDSWGVRPNELLIWHAVEWASNSGISSLDLGPTPVEVDSGLNVFKRHFGAERTDLVRFTLPIHTLRDFMATTLVASYRRLGKSKLFPQSLGGWLQSRFYFD